MVKTTVLLAGLVAVWLPQSAAAQGAREAARCAAWRMGMADAVADPNAAKRSKGEALAYSRVAIRMGYGKGALANLISQERPLWRSHIMSKAETQDPESVNMLAQIETVCQAIRQQAPEFGATK